MKPAAKREPTLNDVVQALRVIHSTATHRAKRTTGEGYTYEQGRIDTVNEIMKALDVRCPGCNLLDGDHTCWCPVAQKASG